MKIDKRDWLFIALVATVLSVVFIASNMARWTGKKPTKSVPNNPIHHPVYQEAYKNAPAPDASLFKKTFFRPAKKDAEQLCEPCHQQYDIKLPPNHPPKHRCLFCHKLEK